MRQISDLHGRPWSVSVEAAPFAELVFRHGQYTLATPYPSSTPLDALTDAELRQSLGQATPTTRLGAERLYQPGRHGFFDELVLFLASALGLGIGLDAARRGSTVPYGSHDGVELGGTYVSGLSFVTFPAEVLTPIASNEWPKQVRLFEAPAAQVPPDGEVTIEPSARTITLLAGAAFLQYYERCVELWIQREGQDPALWTGPWAFARVIRNAVAHGGLLDIRNPRAPTVAWRSLQYTPADTGRLALCSDIGTVELVLLMEDMNSALLAA